MTDRIAGEADAGAGPDASRGGTDDCEETAVVNCFAKGCALLPAVF